jgi:glycosyltransferase involved in cell wall biosynthesis
MSVSFFMPVYNEIRFIRRTLESIISEADEILISDFGSTDGTLEVLDEFVSKYPKVIYANHQNWRYSDRTNWFFQNAHGKYVRLIGGHDMVSTGSTKSMLALLESDPDAVMVYSKYCIELNSDYTFYNFLNMKESWIKILSANSPFDRVRGSITDLHCYIYYSMYKKEVFELAMKSSVFIDIQTDMALISFIAGKGKLLADNSSIFFWMNPRPRLDGRLELKRTALTISNGKTDHPFYWGFLIMCGQYDIAKEMQTWQSAPNNFSNELLNLIMQGQHFLFSDNYEINQFVLPSYQVRSDKEDLCNEVFHAVHYKKIEEDIKNRRVFLKCFRIIIKLIKYTLPYGFVRLIQEIKKRF